MNSDRFEALKKNYPEIYENVMSAFENKVIEPDITAFKIRKSLESLIAIVGTMENIQLFSTLKENINLLYEKRVIDDQIKDTAEYIRKAGNVGVHQNNTHIFLSRNILEAFFHFFQWFMYRYENVVVEEQLVDSPSMKLKNRFSLISDEKEKNIFDSAMRALSLLTEELIIAEKLSGIGVINEIPFLSFEEYTRYFIKALQALSSHSIPELGITSERSLEFILKFREIARNYYNIGDDYKLNKILAENLYKHTHWYWQN